MVKRKYDGNDESMQTPKQPKLASFPTLIIEHTNDVEMFDCASDDSPAQSLVGLPASDAVHANGPYPAFNLYPLPAFAMDSDGPAFTPSIDSVPVTPVDGPRAVGLMQPLADTPTNRHGPNCTQIPKLRMSCSAGLYGHRTMWSHCEQCGAIELVQS